METIPKGLTSFENGLVKILEYFAIYLLIALFIVVFLAVVDRFILLQGWGWTEETARFLLVWGAFMAFALCVNKGLHYKVTFFSDRFLGKKAKINLNLSINVICLLITLLIGYKGLILTFDSTNQLSPALRMSMSYIYIGIPVCAILIAIFLLINIFHNLYEYKG